MRRLIILLTAVGALLIAPAAHAEVGVEPVKVILTGSGSGKAFIALGGKYRGSPEINCSYNGTSQSGVCETTMSDEGEGFEQVFITVAAEPGSKFTGWKVENTEFEGCVGTFATCAPYVEPSETGSGEAKVIATFELNPLVSLTINPAGTGEGKVECKVNGSAAKACAAEYPEGTELALVAAPKAGSEFAGFSAGTGSATACTGSPCEFTIEEDSVVTATFDLEPPSEFALTVVPAGSGSGTVTSAPAGINCGIDCSEAYAAGTEVTLTATAASGSTFSGWSGACAGAGACKVTMSQARSVTATFAKEPASPPPGTVSVAPTAKVKSGKALLKLTCNGEGPCKGSLKLTAKIKSGGKTKNKTIGKGSFSLAAGAKATLKVKLSAPAKQAVAKKPLKAKVSGSGVRSSTVKLKK